jgi:hypothetical protein
MPGIPTFLPLNMHTFSKFTRSILGSGNPAVRTKENFSFGFYSKIDSAPESS